MPFRFQHSRYYTLLVFGFVIGFLLTSSASASGRMVLPESILKLDNPSRNAFKVKLDTLDQKTHYVKGDAIQYSISANTNCYFCLLSFQSDGSWLVLYPNPFETKIDLPADTTRFIPDQNQNNYQFVVDAPYGTDTICVVACSTEESLAQKINELTSESTSYISLNRGVFPMAISKKTTMNPDSPSWDIDILTITTSETPVPVTALLLSQKQGVLVTIGGVLMLLISGLLLWKK